MSTASVTKYGLLGRLVRAARSKWDDNAVEALAGYLSTVITEAQLEVLVKDLETN